MSSLAYRIVEPEYLSVADYLAGEELAEERHEYVNGRVFAMAGASEPHEIVALNLSAAILFHLRGKGCRVFKGDMKVRLRLNQVDLFYYPDVMVACDPADNHPAYKERPKVIVEVMTDYRADHVEKLFAYQQIPSLEEYLVINQSSEQPQACLYRRDANWGVANRFEDGIIHLESIGFRHALSELYVME
jgi:Uma2 family endonuclease